MTEPGRAESAAALAQCPRLAAGEPFDFVCAGCGDCCRNRRDLVLSGYDLYRIARRLGLPTDRATVRDLAAEAGVNPNTMQRAMMEMEREELVHSQRTAGRFVTEDAQRIRQLRESMARQRVKEFLEGMYLLGFQTEEIVAFVQKEGENHEHSGV